MNAISPIPGHQIHEYENPLEDTISFQDDTLEFAKLSDDPLLHIVRYTKDGEKEAERILSPDETRRLRDYLNRLPL